jgi:hypothetical protein
MDEIAAYEKALPARASALCRLLRKEIGSGLKSATARIYYAMPVWFLDGNPIVGYKAIGETVELLFWSGRSFGEESLRSVGKFQAAKIPFKDVSDIDKAALRRWLKKARVQIWDYQNIRKNGGLKRLA